eukprot:5814857-Pyramimonas_sp.AAC.1
MREFLGPYAGTETDSAVNLVIGDTGGKTRRAARRGTKFRARVHHLKQTTKQIIRMKCGLGKYSNRIWITGALPGVLYGSEMNGLSDFELLKVRREAGKVLRPSAKGRSLTATMICHNDTVWLGAVSASLRYSKEVWALQTHSYPYSLSWKQLRE